MTINAEQATRFRAACGTMADSIGKAVLGNGASPGRHTNRSLWRPERMTLRGWQHPELGLVLPDGFIELVQAGDLAVPLGTWVIESAVEQAAAWQSVADSDEVFWMSVNVAPRQLSDPGFVEVVTNALALHGLAPRTGPS